MPERNIKYYLISGFIKVFTSNRIIAKPLHNANKLLYYERHQFLSYFMQKRIKHEIDVQNNIKKYIKEGDTVFDIGANIGQYSLLFSDLVGDNGKVFSFEPDPKSFAFLNFNININECRNVETRNYGIGRNSEKRIFYRDLETGGRRGSFKEGFVEKENLLTITVKGFAEIVREFGMPDFVKIDVEGFENEIIEGITFPIDETIFLVEVRNSTKEIVYEFFRQKDFNCTRVDCEIEKEINDINKIPQAADLLFKKNV